MIKKYDMKNILKFTIPSMTTMIFIAIYVMADGIIVSNYINETALSAINLVLPITSFILAIGLMLGAGGTAICSKLLGENKNQKAKENLTLFVLTGIVLGIIATILVQVFVDPIIRALGVDEETYQYAYDYVKTISIFFSGLILQTIFLSIMASVRKSSLFLISMVVGGVSRIVLGYVLIEIVGLGIQGSAIAASCSYLIPSIVSIIYLLGRKNRILHFVKPKFDGKALIEAAINGSSEMVTNLSTAVTTFLFNQAMLTLVGNSGVAAITVILYIQFLLSSLFMGYAIGIAPLIGFSYGQKQKENLQKIFRNSIKIILIMSAISLVASILFRNTLASIFTEVGTDVYNLATEGLSIFAISFIFIGINVFASGMFTAYSNGKISAIISFVRTVGLISICILVLPKYFGITGVWVAVPIAEFIALFISIFFFVKYRKKYMYGKSDEQIIENDLNNSEIKKEKSLDNKNIKDTKNTIITVNRQFGSGGREIAKRLSEELNMPYYDKEILNNILVEDGISEEMLKQFSDTNYSKSFNFSFANTFTNPNEDLSMNVFEQNRELILKLSKQNGGIFVGRCSDYILQEMNPFKIYIYSSDIDYMIDRCYEKVESDKSKSRNQIEKNINEINAKRKEYYEYYTDKMWADSENYNLVIDVSKIGIKEAVHIISEVIKNVK